MFDLFPAFNDVIKTFEDPQRLHAMMVHIPIAIALLGFILTLGVTLTGSKASGLRWTTVFIFLLGTLAALWASYTGEEAEHHLPIKPSTVGQELLDKHKQLAEYFWISLAATGGLILLSTVRVTWFRSVTLVFALLTSAASVVWVAAIGHYGGEMVYRESVGVPSAGIPVTSTPAETKDAAKDARDTIETKDKTAPSETKDKAVDPAPEKDKATPEKDNVKIPAKDSGERKLPDVESKDKNIFDP